MKNLFTPSHAKFKFRFVLMALVLFVAVYACKRELYDGEKIDPKRRQEMLAANRNGPKVQIMNLDQFKKKANINALGTLKQQFVTAVPSKSKVMAVNTAETYLGFQIITDSIKVISDKGHTMYVFPVVLASNKAKSFQNLTIDESAAGTTAFVNTYTPTKKWVQDWKKEHPGKFEGTIEVTHLNLNNGYTPPPKPSVSANTKTKGSNIIANVQICSTITYYYEIPYMCSSGQHNPGDLGCSLAGDKTELAIFISGLT